MAIDNLGISFLDQNGTRRRRPEDISGPGRLGSAVQLLALQLPRLLGRQSIAPAPLLRSQGGGSATGLAGASPVGPHPGGVAEAVASAVLSEVLGRAGRPGVGTDIVSRLRGGGDEAPRPSGLSTPVFDQGPTSDPGPQAPPRVITPPSITPGSEPGSRGGGAPPRSATLEDFSYEDFDQGAYQLEQARRQMAGEEPISPFEFRFPQGVI